MNVVVDGDLKKGAMTFERAAVKASRTGAGGLIASEPTIAK